MNDRCGQRPYGIIWDSFGEGVSIIKACRLFWNGLFDMYCKSRLRVLHTCNIHVFWNEFYQQVFGPRVLFFHPAKYLVFYEDIYGKIIYRVIFIPTAGMLWTRLLADKIRGIWASLKNWGWDSLWDGFSHGWPCKSEVNQSYTRISRIPSDIFPYLPWSISA